MRLFCHWYADGKERLFLQSNPLQQDFFVNYSPFHPFLRHRHPFFFRTFWPALIPMPVIFLFSPQTLSCRPDAASFFLLQPARKRKQRESLLRNSLCFCTAGIRFLCLAPLMVFHFLASKPPRYHSQYCIANCTHQCDSIYHSCNIVAGRLTRSDTRYKSTIFLHIHRNLIRVDHDGRIKIGEENNQDNIQTRTNGMCHI